MPRSRAAPAPARSASGAASRPKPAASSSSSAPPQSTPMSASTPAQQPSSSWWSSSKPASSSAQVPAPAASAPPPAMQSSGGGGLMSGLLGTVVQGAALGTGSAIAHRAVDSMMGPRETRVVHEHQGAAPVPPPAAAEAPMPASQGPCAARVQDFAECMSRNSGDMGACQDYFNAMQQCKAAFA